MHLNEKIIQMETLVTILGALMIIIADVLGASLVHHNAVDQTCKIKRICVISVTDILSHFNKVSVNRSCLYKTLNKPVT